MGAHLIDGEFQSDKYPTTPRGKVPLSVKDVTAQDLLWTYAQRRRSVDAEFSDDLETALKKAGYEPGLAIGGTVMIETESQTVMIPRADLRRVSVTRNGSYEDQWVLTYALVNVVTDTSIVFSGDRRPATAIQAGVTVGEYNRTTATMLMSHLTRGKQDMRFNVQHSAARDVKSPDGR